MSASAHLIGMTTDATISRFEKFDLDGRSRALTAGTPETKLHSPSVFYPHVPNLVEPKEVQYLLVNRRKGALRVRSYNRFTHSFSDPLADRFDAEDLARRALVSTQVTREAEEPTREDSTGGVIVVPDIPTRNLLLSTLSKNEENQELHRALSAMSMLPSSSRFIVLTEALKNKFFLQQGLDEDTLAGWVQGFGWGQRATAASVLRLLSLVYQEGLGNPDEPLPDMEAGSAQLTTFAREMVRCEARLSEFSASGSMPSECSRFSSVTTITDHWSFVNIIDPLRREYHRLDGTVFDLTDIGDSQYLASGSASTRAGKDIVMLDNTVHTKIAAGTTRSVRDVTIADGGAVIMTLSPPRRSRRGGHQVWPRQVTCTEVPFLVTFRGREGTKWAPESEVERVKREVPLYVSVAALAR